jgi:hypothetical protein
VLKLREFSKLLAWFHGAMTAWLTHEQKHLRVLGWITWILVLGMPVAVVVVLVLNWTIWATVGTATGLTGLVAGGDRLRRLRRGSD